MAGVISKGVTLLTAVWSRQSFGRRRHRGFILVLRHASLMFALDRNVLRLEQRRLTSTPNGWKVSILLKELKYPHVVKPISLAKNEQKEPWFLKINPNGRIPAIIDHDNNDFAVFESGAILMYLAERSGKFFPQEWSKKSEVIQWLMFQMGGIGPMQGQANHFIRYAPEDIEYAKKRYRDETLRLYGVLDKHLEGKEWLAADEYTIADMATFPWIVCAPFLDISLDSFPNLDAYCKRIHARPAVVEGLDVPDEFPLKHGMDPEKMAAKLAESRKWIQDSIAKK